MVIRNETDWAALAARENQHEEQPSPVKSLASIDVLGRAEILFEGQPDLVLAMQARIEIGAHRYGQRLCSHNGRDAVRDAREEAIDGVLYSVQILLETDPSDELRERFCGEAAGHFAMAYQFLGELG